MLCITALLQAWMDGFPHLLAVAAYSQTLCWECCPFFGSAAQLVVDVVMAPLMCSPEDTASISACGLQPLWLSVAVNTHPCAWCSVDAPFAELRSLLWRDVAAHLSIQWDHAWPGIAYLYLALLLPCCRQIRLRVMFNMLCTCVCHVKPCDATTVGGGGTMH